MHEVAAVPPGGAQALEALAVQDIERVAQRRGGALVVGEPPAGLRATAVRIHVFHLYALVQTVLATRAPEARCLRAAPRSLAGRERVAEVVHPHHPDVEPAGDAICPLRIARPDAGA